MILRRRPGLVNAVVCLCLSIPSVALAQQPASQANTPAPQQPKNPFEAVPQGAEPPKPQAPPAPGQPKLEAPTVTQEPKPQTLENTIEAIEFRGARRVPQDTL